MKLKNTAFKIDTAYDSGIDKYDVISFGKMQTAIVISKVANGEATTLKVFPFIFSKWKLWNITRLWWIRMRVFFNFI